jgi:hypothetical protein
MGIDDQRQKEERRIMKKFRILLLVILLNACASAPSHLRIVNEETMLIGAISQEELFSEFPVFKNNFDKYIPLDSVITSLKSRDDKIHIEIFLGTWCGDSKRNLAYFLKVLETTNQSNFTYTMHALDRTKKDKDGMAEKYAIVRVPTMIFLKDNMEIGRITEHPVRSVEEDILAILRQ